MIYKRAFTRTAVFFVAFLIIYDFTRVTVDKTIKESVSPAPPKTRAPRIIFDNTFAKPFQDFFLRMMLKFIKGSDNFQTNKPVSNKTFEEIYKIEKENKFKTLGIHSHDIKFVHNLPMLIHFIWINNDVRTRNNYDNKTEENLKTFSIYEKTGWKIILWVNKKVYNIFCTDNNRNKELCEILTNIAIAKQYKITLSMKSDMLRFVIMHEFGGMYFDTDFIALRNMDQIIRDKIKEHGLIVVHEVNERRSMYLAGEFFTAYPGNICIENAKNHVLEAIKGKEESNIRTGPYFFKKALVSTHFDTFNIDSDSISKFNLSKVATVLPTKYLYSFPSKQKKDMVLLEKVKKLPETFYSFVEGKLA